MVGIEKRREKRCVCVCVGRGAQEDKYRKRKTIIKETKADTCLQMIMEREMGRKKTIDTQAQ